MQRLKDLPSGGLSAHDSLVETRRFRRIEKAKKDKQQTVFGVEQHTGATVLRENKAKFAKVEAKGIDPFHDATCPFCLATSKLRLFIISTKKGFNQGLGKCPVCGNGARLMTITWLQSLLNAPNGPEKYAEFVFNYRQSGFWQKHEAKHQQWKDFLRAMNWTQRFWVEYKRLRGDPEEEAAQKQAEEAWSGYEEDQEAAVAQ